MDNPISKWIREVRQVPAGDGPAPDIVFRQRVERWVEFKRLHLSFTQTLNSLICGHSSLLTLIKYAMLCENEVREMVPAAPDGTPDDLNLDTVLRRLPLVTYSQLYRLVNSRAFSDEALKALVAPGDFRVAQIILAAVAMPLAPCDALFARLAREHGFEGGERAGKWTPEITALNTDIVKFYKATLRSKGLL